MLTFSPASAFSPHICASASAPQSGFTNKEYVVFDLCMNEIDEIPCRKNSQLVGLYFTLTCGLLLLYWLWFIYLKYAVMETEASKEVPLQYDTMSSFM